MATGQQVAQNVAQGIEVLATIGRTERTIMPYATFIAGFFPGVASVLAAIQIAQPYIDKAIAAAPAVEAAITSGAPIFDAIQQAGPSVLTHIKEAFAIFANTDPTRPEIGITAADVSNEDALRAAGPILFGRAWTTQEEARLFAKADGGGITDGVGQRTDGW